jgi:hypothetical protein
VPCSKAHQCAVICVDTATDLNLVSLAGNLIITALSKDLESSEMHGDLKRIYSE